MTEAVKVRTRPVECEAFCMTRERSKGHADWPAWLRGAMGAARLQVSLDSFYVWPTVAGQSRRSWGDWIILTAGELSVCTPAEFEAGYEAVGERSCAGCGGTNVQDPPRLVWCDDCRSVSPAGGTS